MIGFGNFGAKRNLEIKSLSDERLMMVNPMEAGFYDKVLNFESENNDIQKFVEAVREVQEVGVAPFYKPAMDPSLEGDKVVYAKGKKPAVGHSYNWWVKAVNAMPAVENRKWEICSEYQRYVFLNFLINRAVENGWYVKKAIEAVVLNSKELGHYRNSEGAKGYFEPTGSREIFGFYDLVNTCKMVSCTYGEGFWIAGGNCNSNSDIYPLADLGHCNYVDNNYDFIVAELVLKK